jgi:hypothetical protein
LARSFHGKPRFGDEKAEQRKQDFFATNGRSGAQSGGKTLRATKGHKESQKKTGN